MTNLLHEELSYAVRGVLYDVHNQIGPMLPEQIYNQAVAIGLEKQGIHCQTEKSFEVTYRGVQVGRYAVDVWVEEGKLLLELKVAPQIEPFHKAQAISYLKVTDADLAFVVNFGEEKVTIQRLPNFVRDKPVAFDWEKCVLLVTIAVGEVTEAMKRQLKVRMKQLNHKLGLIANFHGMALETMFVRV